MGRRKLIYVSEINKETFLFFFEKGDSGRSYSFRDYSQGTPPVVMYADSYSYTADDILAMAKWCFDAPVHDTKDAAFWHEEVMSLNKRFLGSSKEASPSRWKRGLEGERSNSDKRRETITSNRNLRVDNRGRAYAGSQLQIQIYVNKRPEYLSQCVQNSLPELALTKTRIRWVSPLEEEKFTEYQDEDFLHDNTPTRVKA